MNFVQKIALLSKAQPTPSITKLALRYAGATSEVNSIIPDPKKICTDMVGPADPVSNLRRIVFREPPDETELEKKYRETRIQVQEWNQQFWTQHNTNFFEDREEYLKKNLPDGKQNLTADEMSVFYKSFLDKNWNNHVDYNIEWYKKNLALIGMAIKIKLYRLLKL